MGASDHARLHSPGLVLLHVAGLGGVDFSGYKRVMTYNGSYGTSAFGHTSLDMEGTDDVLAASATLGNVLSVSFLCKPDTTTEQLILFSAGNSIAISSGTITYTGVTGAATYVDGQISTTLVAGKWQHVMCVLSAATAATTFKVGTDGSAFGAAEFAHVRAFSFAATQNEAVALNAFDRR